MLSANISLSHIYRYQRTCQLISQHRKTKDLYLYNVLLSTYFGHNALISKFKDPYQNICVCNLLMEKIL